MPSQSKEITNMFVMFDPRLNRTTQKFVFFSWHCYWKPFWAFHAFLMQFSEFEAKFHASALFFQISHFTYNGRSRITLNTPNSKHSLWSNTKGYVDKTHQTESQNSYTTAPSGRELYLLQLSLQAASVETFGYTLAADGYELWFIRKKKMWWSRMIKYPSRPWQTLLPFVCSVRRWPPIMHWLWSMLLAGLNYLFCLSSFCSLEELLRGSYHLLREESSFLSTTLK
jgi:hypothetical protein